MADCRVGVPSRRCLIRTLPRTLLKPVVDSRAIPTLEELPPPPPGKDGWPWTEASAPLPAAMSDGSPWPRITVVTPSFNQGEYIEETIRSVLLQGYPNLQYIVIDGASGDQSVEVIRKYAPWLHFWVSEPDDGQTHAINKGYARATGDVINWINSDDMLAPGALKIVGERIGGVDAVAGGSIDFDEDGHEELRYSYGLNPRDLVLGTMDAAFQQPSVWLRTEAVRACGGLDDHLQYSFDRDLYIRYFYLYPQVAYVEEPLALFRLHDTSKSQSQVEPFIRDRLATAEKLRRDDRFESLQAVCEYRARELKWKFLMRSVVNRASVAAFWRACALAALACMDPRVRWDDDTIDLVKHLVRGRDVRMKIDWW